MGREDRLLELKDRVGNLVDRRVEEWEGQAALLRAIIEGRTSDGEVANHLVTLNLPYIDQSVKELLAADQEEGEG